MIHESTKPFKCPKCGKGHSQKGNCLRHARKCGAIAK